MKADADSVSSFQNKPFLSSDEGNETDYWPCVESFDRAKLLKVEIASPAQLTRERTRERSKQIQLATFSALRLESPQYAFPAAYPPLCSEDPFPCRFGDMSFCKARLGRRERPEVGQLQEGTYDVSSLTAAFEKLSIRESLHDYVEDGNMHAASEASGTKVKGAVSPFITRPLRAPLESLVRNKNCRRETVSSLSRVASSSASTPGAVRTGKDLCFEEREYTLDSQRSHSYRTHVPIEAGDADPAPLHTLSSDSEEDLPDLSYASSTSASSDDGRSQDSPVLSVREQDFLSPLLPYVDSLSYPSLIPFFDTKL